MDDADRNVGTSRNVAFRSQEGSNREQPRVNLERGDFTIGANSVIFHTLGKMPGEPGAFSRPKTRVRR